MHEKIDGLDEASYVTHTISFKGGHKLTFPILMGKSMPILENVYMMGLSRTSEETIISVTCLGFGVITEHWHEGTSEEIRVQSGVVTDIKSGRMYRAGEVWSVEADEVHAATFQDCVLIVVLRPTLPTAAERPVNLDAMESIFP